MGVGFIARGQQLVAALGPLGVGIDPHPHLLESWGLPVSASGLSDFTQRCLAAFAGKVAVVKPQLGLFEAFGSQGFRVYEQLVQDFSANGTLVIADAKRGDIGSTMMGYARAWLDPSSALAADAVTLNPYLGPQSLVPAVEVAAEHGKAIFMLARTSNPEAVELQSAVTSHQVSVAQYIVEQATLFNQKYAPVGADRHAASEAVVGLVVGATADHGLDLVDFTGALVVPGLGSQGGTVQDVARIFPPGLRGSLLLPHASRSILSAGPGVDQLRSAAAKLNEDLGKALDVR